MTALRTLRPPDRLYHTLSVRQLADVTLPPTVHVSAEKTPTSAIAVRSNKKVIRKRSQLRSARIDTDAECNDRNPSNASDLDYECDDLLAPRSRRQTEVKGTCCLHTAHEMRAAHALLLISALT